MRSAGWREFRVVRKLTSDADTLIGWNSCIFFSRIRWQNLRQTVAVCSHFSYVRYHLVLTKSQKRYFTKSNHRYIPFSIKEPFPLCHSHSKIGCATAAFPWQGISGSTLNSGVEFFDSLRRRTSFWHEQLLVWCFLVLVDLNSLDEAIVYRNDSSKGLNHWITLLRGSTAQMVWFNDPFLKLQWQDLGAMAH